MNPLEWVLADGSKLAIGMAAQLRVNVTDDGHVLGEGGRDTESGVELRRVRLSLRGAFLNERLKTLLQLSFAPGNPELIEARALG